MRNLLIVTSALLLSTACAERPEDIAEELITERDIQANDVGLQGPGIILQGPGIILQGPGIILQGPGIILQGPGIILQGPGIILQGPGIILQGMQLVGTSFSATVNHDGEVYQVEGLDFIGAEMDLNLKSMVDGVETSQMVRLRIKDIEQSEAQPDILVYDLEYRELNSTLWRPYCGPSQAGAVPLLNSWDVATGDRIDDPSAVTFGCTNAVLAKCALWGYRPWATKTVCEGKGKKKKCKEVSLQDHHQACTRMARADYCGDGTSATVDGTAIDVWDNLDIQTQFTDWEVEAEWSPEGATCVNFVRHPELGYPSCFLKKGKPMKFNDCKGELKDDDALIATAFSADDDDDDDDDCNKGKKK